MTWWRECGGGKESSIPPPFLASGLIELEQPVSFPYTAQGGPRSRGSSGLISGEGILRDRVALFKQEALWGPK